MSCDLVSALTGSGQASKSREIQVEAEDNFNHHHVALHTPGLLQAPILQLGTTGHIFRSFFIRVIPVTTPAMLLDIVAGAISSRPRQNINTV